MEGQRKSLLVRALILTTLLVSGVARAQDGGPQSPAGPAEALGTGFTYQGRLDLDGSPVNDTCDMNFKLYDAASLGAQVGSTFNTSVPITDGLFSVTLDFGTDAFDGDRRWLGIEVDCEEDSTYADLGRQELTAAPYALYAARSGGPENVVTVAKGGGDYTSVQTAIDSITDATENNPYLVWVASGVYSETVTMKPHVHLQGAGQEVTVITSTATSESSPPDQATLMLARDTSVRDLTVGNSGAGSFNAALLATDGATRTLVADVTARAQGGGTNNYAFLLIGSDTGVALQHVTGLAENSGYNFGLYSVQGADVVVYGGSFTGRGGNMAEGIYNHGSGTTLKAEGVTALGESGSSNTKGLDNGDGAEATLSGGSFIGRGGGFARGITNTHSDTTVEATGVIALGENGSSSNYGLLNEDGANAVLQGGSFTGRGGTTTRGIWNHDSGTTLRAMDVTALAENGSDSNYGLRNNSAEAVLHGGSFTARGGLTAWGITNGGSGATLKATGVTGLAENGSDTNYGLYSGSAVTEVDSSRFTGSQGLHQDGGTVRLGVTQLDGGAALTSGTLTCFQVYDGSYASYTCP
jgi:hypothetical protein